jgi:lysophospholipase L1-like esterase
MRHRVAWLLAAVVLLGGAAPDYVAMGSSFAAGPGIGVRAPGSIPACRQSASNYPHLLAKKRGLVLADVTCSGATTRDILVGRPGALPQIAAVGSQVRLVTVTIGGNDVFYMRNLWAWSCPEGHISMMARLLVCHEVSAAAVESAFSGLAASLTEIVRQVHQRAPAARVVFVDYLTVLPESGMCAAAPMPAADYAAAREMARRLLAITHEVAAATKSGLVSAAALTRGHDVCAKDPWVTGFTFSPGVDGFGTIAYHPTQASMDAVAAALDNALGK